MFRLVKILGGRTNQAEPVFLSATAGEAYEMGEALTLARGTLTKCPAGEAPAFICGVDCPEAGEEGRLLVVYPVAHDMIFECPVTESPTAKATKRTSIITAVVILVNTVFFMLFLLLSMVDTGS